jgi:hypothetical protein
VTDCIKEITSEHVTVPYDESTLREYMAKCFSTLFERAPGHEHISIRDHLDGCITFKCSKCDWAENVYARERFTWVSYMALMGAFWRKHEHLVEPCCPRQREQIRIAGIHRRGMNRAALAGRI